MKGREIALASNPESVFSSGVHESLRGPRGAGIGPTTNLRKKAGGMVSIPQFLAICLRGGNSFLAFVLCVYGGLLDKRRCRGGDEEHGHVSFCMSTFSFSPNLPCSFSRVQE